jgi:hypothetical protein
MKPTHNTAAEYSRLQVITWLCACHISSQPKVLQWNGGSRENRNSLTQLKAGIPGAESIPGGPDCGG